MASTSRLQKSLDVARTFIEPAILHDPATPGTSAAKVIARRIYGNNDDAHQRDAILQACQMLKDIAGAMVAAHKTDAASQSLETGVMTVVFPLLDLILLEGLYPSLYPGVGFPEERKRRSTLCNRSLERFSDLDMLSVTMSQLNALTFDPACGLYQQLQNTILLDVIAANAQMAYLPGRAEHDRKGAAKIFTQQLQQVSTSRLHQTLTSLIRPPAPSWLRNGLSGHLSMLPLRPRGLQQTVEFLASYYDVRLPSGIEPQAKTVKRRPIHPEALAQATKVLTSVPSTMTAVEYYTLIAPQFVSLLDGVSGEEVAHASASIIANGVLSKRDIGAPGAIGWKLFIAPQLAAIRPPENSFEEMDGSDATQVTFIVDQSRLETALRRLVMILQATIHVSVTGRLLRPILLCIWGLAAYDASSMTDLTSARFARELCEMFLQRCGTFEHLVLIHDNILFDGEDPWMYGPGDMAGIATRFRGRPDHNDDTMRKMERTITRLDKFVDLMAASQMSGKALGDFIIYALGLLRLKQKPTAMLGSDQDSMESLMVVHLVKALLKRFGQILAAEPQQLLQFIDQILLEAIEGTRTDRQKETLTISSFANILGDGDTAKSANEVSEDMIATAMSLLTSLLGSQQLPTKTAVEPLLQDLADHAQSLHSSGTDMSPATRSALSSGIGVLKSVIEQGSSLDTSKAGVSASTMDRMSSITDPAGQAQLLSQFSSALNDDRSDIDVSASAIALLEQLRIGPDAYVEPIINNVLAKLAAKRAPGYVLRATMGAFRDADEETDLGGRLRIAEALIFIIDVLNVPDVGISSTSLADLMVSVAHACMAVISRRTRRSLEHMTRTQTQKQAGVESRSTAPEPNNDEDLDAEARERQEQDYSTIQKIVRGWEGMDKKEDIRIRTSAMSVLSTVLERAGQVLASSTIRDAIDGSMAVLSIERGDEAVILRRAAVLVPMAHLRAVSAGLENGITVASLDAVKWLEVQNRLTTISQTDADDLIRANAKAVLESLQSLRIQQMIHENDALSNINQDGLSLNELQGLSVNPKSDGRSKIEVID